MRIRKPLLAAAALRLALMFAAYHLTGTAVMTQGDTQSYLTPGRNLLLHGAYITGTLPEIDRTPGYPLFVMLTGMIVDNVLLVVLAQIVVSLISLYLVARIASRIFANQQAGERAAWLYALEPLSILLTARLMPETLFVLLLLAVIDRLIAFLASARLRWIVLAGVFLAAATYVRPVGYYLALPLATGLVFAAPKQNGLRWKAPIVLLLTVVPLISAWQVRNDSETGYKGFSSIVEKNLYFYQSAGILAQVQHKTFGVVQQQLGYPDESSYRAAHPEQSTWTQAQRLQFMHSEALRVLQMHRALYLRSHLAGVGVVAITPCASEWLQLLGIYPDEQSMPHRILNEGVVASALRIASEHPAVFTLMAALECILLGYYALACMGCFSATAERRSIYLLVGIALYFMVIAGGAQAIGRYRIPVMPELCILAGGGLATRTKRSRTSSREPAPPIQYKHEIRS